MALASFEIVSAYDCAIYTTLSKRMYPQKSFSDSFFVSARGFEVPKYGENPGSKSDDRTRSTVRREEFPNGIKFLEIPVRTTTSLDVASSFEILEGFEDFPAAATVKHGQISGFAYSTTLSDAYRLAHACDPEADFGNTTVFNRRIDVETAKLVGKNEGTDDDSVYTEIVRPPASRRKPSRF